MSLSAKSRDANGDKVSPILRVPLSCSIVSRGAKALVITIWQCPFFP
jgi:hypothetical protein